MGVFEDTMPIISGFNIPVSEVITALKKNKESLRTCRGQELTKKIAAEILEIMALNGSLKNAGGYIGVAKQVGCTIEQAETVVKEIVAGFDYLDAAGMLDDE